MNMKYLLITILSIATILSCEKEAADLSCREMQMQSSWTTERFKTDFDIQFPDDYEGIGITGFEGNIFFKNKTDSTAFFSYNFCSPLFCEDFGDTLNINIPDSVIFTDPDGQERTLDNQQFFCEGADTTGVLYYEEAVSAFGLYYMKIEDRLLEGLIIEFEKQNLEELKDIIGSINAR